MNILQHLILGIFLASGIGWAADTPAMASVRWSNKVLIDTLPRRNFIPEYIAKADLLKAEIPEGTVIRNACFSQAKADTVVFPADMRGVTFLDCNLDNCVVPEGNKTINCMGKATEPKRFKEREVTAGEKTERVLWLLQKGTTEFAETSVDGKTLVEKTAEIAAEVAK